MELLALNEEFLVGAGHQPAPITSLPFVHTARRSYRLGNPVKVSEASRRAAMGAGVPWHLNLII